MKFSDIPLFPQAHYNVDICWDYLTKTVKQHQQDYGLDLSPDFQRGHVWTEEQKIAFVEYVLRGGEHGKSIVFNSPEWASSIEIKSYVIVDGLQRLTAALDFMEGRIPAFGHYIHEFTDKPRVHVRFQWRILALPTREDVLKYYLDFNTGGTSHSKEEIERVEGLLHKEREINRAKESLGG